MKLYIIANASTYAPHILLHELNHPHELEVVDRDTKKTTRGQNYYKLVPPGCVPALQLDDRQILTKVTIILQYLADLYPEREFAPQIGSFDRVRLQRWLDFIDTKFYQRLPELDKRIWTQADQKARGEIFKQLIEPLQIVEDQLTKTSYIMGEQYNIADIFLFATISELRMHGLQLPTQRKILAHLREVAGRLAFKKAMTDEYLEPEK